MAPGRRQALLRCNEPIEFTTTATRDQAETILIRNSMGIAQPDSVVCLVYTIGVKGLRLLNARSFEGLKGALTLGGYMSNFFPKKIDRRFSNAFVRAAYSSFRIFNESIEICAPFFRAIDLRFSW